MDKLNLKSAQILLPYYKQGDDMQRCMVKENGKVDARASISNHIDLLQAAIEQLQQIYDRLPDGMNFDIEADTHVITLTGDTNIINQLIADELLYEDEYMNQDDESVLLEESGDWDESGPASSEPEYETHINPNSRVSD
jgi:hypothetical protein